MLAFSPRGTRRSCDLVEVKPVARKHDDAVCILGRASRGERAPIDAVDIAGYEHRTDSVGWKLLDNNLVPGCSGCADELARYFWPPGMIAQIYDGYRRNAKRVDRAFSDRPPTLIVNSAHPS
jgi:hypothetical protein